jgi:hypothetical protein
LCFGFLVLPTLILVGWKTSFWPDAALGFVTFGVPFLVIGVQSWSRMSHPERVPVRWPSGYLPGERLQTLQGILQWIWIVGYPTSVAIKHRHSDMHTVLQIISVGSIGWSAVLKAYIADRNYIPPPPDPPKGWSGSIKGIHSEHWGGRQTPKLPS